MSPNFKFSIINEAGQYCYIDKTTKQLAQSSSIVYLDFDPIDFNEDFQATIKRDLVNTGLFINYTLPMSYVKDMKSIIQAALYTTGYTAALKLIIFKKEHTSQQYIKYLQGDLDFTQFSDEQTKGTVKLNLIDSTINGLLKSNENTTYDIPLNDPRALTLKMDGVELKNHAVWVILNGIQSGNNPTDQHIIKLEIAVIDGQNRLDVYSRDWFNYGNFASDVADKPFNFYYSSTSRNIIINYDFELTPTDGTGSSFNFATTSIQVSIIRRRAGTNSIVHTLFTHDDFTVYLNNTFPISGTVTLAAQEGDTYYLFANAFPTGAPTTNQSNALINWAYGGNTKLELYFYSRYPTTDIKMFRIIDVLSTLVSKATNGAGNVQSAFLTYPFQLASEINSIPWNTLITSGDGIRSLTGASIKLSLKKLIQFLSNRWCLGRQLVGNTLYIEPLRDQFKKDSTIATFDDVNSVVVDVAQDLVFSGVKAGYMPQDSDILNGKDEFNTTIEMAFPTGIAGKESLNLVSDIRADIFGIEALRQETKDKDTTDNKDDSGVFVIEANGTPDGAGKYSIQRLAGSNQGVNSPTTIYNQGLSPKRCIISNMPKILGCLHTTNKGKLVFASSLGNANFITSIGSPPTLVIEKQDIDLAQPIFNNTPLYRPYYFTFTATHKDDIFPQILANPYGEISFKNPSNGVYYSGFIVELACLLSHKDAYKVKLICSPGIDLTTLID